MGFSKNDFEKIDRRIEKITTSEVEKIINDEGLPVTDNLEDNNKVYKTDATILFIDIRKSTILTDMSRPESMVKLYRSFMRTCVDCVRKNKGVTRQFLGDRIMGVFIDEINEDGDKINSGITNAINAARAMQTCIDFSLNKHLKLNVNGKVIECGIGIDSGPILITKVGMYGLEDIAEKENETDCVWIGKITNYASKYADMANGGEILISEAIYNNLIPVYKEKFNKKIDFKKGTPYITYSAFDYYLDFYNEIGEPIKLDSYEISDNDKDGQFIKIIDKLEEKYKNVIDIEKKIAVKEGEVNCKAESLIKKIEEAYEYCDKLIREVSINRLQNTNYDFWKMCIDCYYYFGKMKNYNDSYLDQTCDYYFVEIYNYFSMYKEAYKYMIIGVEKSSIMNFKKEPILWAKKNYCLWEIREAINNKKSSTTGEENAKWIEISEKIESIVVE